MGFGAEITSVKEFSRDEYLMKSEPEDLLRFGLIPEFVGRLPVIASLHSLDEKTLYNILTLPRNAIVKQYKKLFEMEGVELEFQEEALKLVVKKAMERGTGARGLRSIIEEVMLEIMYQLPSKKDIAKCIITKSSIEKNREPKYIFHEPMKASA